MNLLLKILSRTVTGYRYDLKDRFFLFNRRFPVGQRKLGRHTFQLRAKITRCREAAYGSVPRTFEEGVYRESIRLYFSRAAGRDCSVRKSESALKDALKPRPNREHEFLAGPKGTEMKVFSESFVQSSNHVAR